MSLQHELCELGAARAAFEALSRRAAGEAPELRVIVPSQILREDVIACLESATARTLAPSDLAAVQRCFALDASALIGWDEFSACLGAANDLARGRGEGWPRARSRHQLMAARRKGLVPPVARGGSAGLLQPLTSSQEIGWYHSEVPVGAGGGALRERSAPLKATDVTRGGEGTTIQTYYGAALGRCF